MFPSLLVFHPERYHGHRRRPPFFEGWYYKLVDASERQRWAVIPGIFLSNDPERHHAFVQVLDGSTGAASYHRFPASAFRASRDALRVRIGPNLFTDRSVVLDLADDERRIRGEVRMGPLSPWPVTPLHLGPMGPYGWLPRMECNHAVVSLDHALDGAVEIDDGSVDLTGGRGYIEKDWGAAFPAGYVWLQTNHFDRPGVSLVASIAIVPWLRGAFPGFFVGLLVGGRLHRFATFTGARTSRLHLDDDHVEWVVADGSTRIELRAQRRAGGLLRAPTREQMGDRVGETMRSTVAARLTDRAGRTRFEGVGRNAGLEVHGDLDRLLALQV